jgi:hypothetical protein
MFTKYDDDDDNDDDNDASTLPSLTGQQQIKPNFK